MEGAAVSALLGRSVVPRRSALPDRPVAPLTLWQVPARPWEHARVAGPAGPGTACRSESTAPVPARDLEILWARWRAGGPLGFTSLVSV